MLKLSSIKSTDISSELQKINNYHFVLVENGRGEIQINNERFKITNHQLISLKPNDKIRFSKATTINGLKLSLNKALFESAINLNHCFIDVQDYIACQSATISLSSKSATKLTILFNNATKKSKAYMIFYDEIYQTALLNFLCKLANIDEFQSKTPTNTNTDLLEKFFSLLELNYFKTHSVLFYSQSLGITRKTLDRFLISSTGKTAKIHIDLKIVLEAKKLLLKRNLSTKLISSKLGFHETSHFTRFFKSKTKKTPSQFKKLSIQRSQ